LTPASRLDDGPAGALSGAPSPYRAITPHSPPNGFVTVPDPAATTERLATAADLVGHGEVTRQIPMPVGTSDGADDTYTPRRRWEGVPGVARGLPWFPVAAPPHEGLG
jgi:hypothetical protein